jgi:hypothetical protein
MRKGRSPGKRFLLNAGWSGLRREYQKRRSLRLHVAAFARMAASSEALNSGYGCWGADAGRAPATTTTTPATTHHRTSPGRDDTIRVVRRRWRRPWDYALGLTKAGGRERIVEAGRRPAIQLAS